jgi:hypothetical protein
VFTSSGGRVRARDADTCITMERCWLSAGSGEGCRGTTKGAGGGGGPLARGGSGGREDGAPIVDGELVERPDAPE